MLLSIEGISNVLYFMEKKVYKVSLLTSQSLHFLLWSVLIHWAQGQNSHKLRSWVNSCSPGHGNSRCNSWHTAFQLFLMFFKALFSTAKLCIPFSTFAPTLLLKIHQEKEIIWLTVAVPTSRGRRGLCGEHEEEDREWRCTLCHHQDSFSDWLQTNMLGCSDPKPEDCIWTAFYWKQTFCFLPSIC